ncbi:MAG: right-handed parallel beta-helix repeat-containing protein, partial [Methanobrevibacter sp.]|nr:right-handed parallel beta-helix repeat-containing protein [Methanobrevibacter sp.]
MNRKILLIATLVVLTIISIGSISAAEIEDEIISDTGEIELDNSINGDVVSEGETPTININNEMTNDEIQTKINTEITDGATIEFAPGEYNNVSLIIGNTDARLSSITINGNGAILKGNPKPNGDGDASNQGDLRNYVGIFEVQGIDGFTLSGFNFIAEGVSGATPKTPSCVIIYATTNGVIENNNITGGRFGLYVGNKFQNGNPNSSNNNTIIRDNFVTGVTDMGIINFASPNSKIINNTVKNPANHGIDVRHIKGNNTLVENNTVIGAKEGIYLMHSSGHNATGNKIINCSEGIVCYGSMKIKIDYNNFSNTRIRILLAENYRQIVIGENNDYGITIPASGVDVPFPPTFPYIIVRGDSEWVNETSGTFSNGDYIINQNNTKIQFYYVSEEGDTVNITDGSINQIDTKTYGLNNIIVKVWIDDTTPITEGQVVKVAIDGKETNMTTDASGAVTIDLSTLTGGQHYITVSFAGNDTIKPSTWSAIFKVPEPAPVKTAITANAINATAKINKTLTVILKDAAGNPLANKTVTYSVNGVTKTAKTNDKGVVKIIVNRVAGTYYYALTFLG